MSATEFKKKIKSNFKGDTVRVSAVADGDTVFLDAIDRVSGEGRSVAIIHFAPEQARQLAKALKKAARKAEG